MEFVPSIISWNLTQRCNLGCAHCYITAASAATKGAGGGPPAPPGAYERAVARASRAGPDELSTEEALRVLGEIAETSPETLLILSGGEPLLRPDLDLLVARAAALGMTAVLGTNGTLLTFDRARALAERGLKAVGVSLDSALPSRHDAFRGRKGAWDGAVRGIKAARQAGLEVQVQMTLTRENIEELPAVSKLAGEAGARALLCFFLVCTGRGQGLVDLSPEEYEQILRRLVDDPGEGIMVRPRCAPTFRRVLAQRHPGSILLQSDAGRCLAGKSYVRITPDGKLTPCPYMPLEAGSLRERSFGAIWRSAPLFESLRAPSLEGRCGRCEYRDICGGCRARAFARTGDPLAEDPWCTYVPGTDPRPEKPEEAALSWTAEAEARLERVPFFVRKVVRSAVEAFARRRGLSSVTPELLDEARRTLAKR